jgi:predicted transglutaminase-like cysteine proteinase
MSNQFPLRRVSKWLLILSAAIQIPVTAIAEPAASAHLYAVNGEVAGFTPVTTTSQRIHEPFGLAAANTADGESIAIWRSVESGIRADHEILVRCQADKDCPPAAQRLLKIVADGRDSSGRAQIGIINRAINLAIQPAKTTPESRAPDRWDSPLESFAGRQADCKNYAVAKYLALLEAGIPATDIRLVIVHDRVVDQNHAVVAVRLDQHWLVLDNRWLALAEDTELARFAPLFVLAFDGFEQHPAVLVNLFASPQRLPSRVPGAAAYYAD